MRKTEYCFYLFSKIFKYYFCIYYHYIKHNVYFEQSEQINKLNKQNKKKKKKKKGESADDALSLAGSITGIAQTCALIAAIPSGYLCSKVDSALSMFILGMVALVGYSAMSFVEDPTGVTGKVIACVIGMGEIGVIIGAQNLVSKHSPRKVRGSIGGAFGLCGSIGILICTKVVFFFLLFFYFLLNCKHNI